MQDKILRKIFLGFIHIHILHHAKEEAFYGTWMIEELKEHGYDMSAGTLYPILHNLEKGGFLLCESRTVEGKVRKYYSATESGIELLEEAKKKVKELSSEM